jgi:predicted nucleic acid-binding protein
MAERWRVLVDTNVVLDVIQQREPFYEDSASILDAVAYRTIEGMLAAHSVTTLFYVINRQQGYATAVHALHRLLEYFAITPVDDVTIRQALIWGWRDFEDAVQMAAASQHHLDYIVSRNPKDFETQPVPVLSPAGLLALLRAEG